MGKLKRLKYLNVALNNVTKIENLKGCESLRKLDLTYNFVSLENLHSVKRLNANVELRSLFLMGNPCAESWEKYRAYVAGSVRRLEYLDGIEITEEERKEVSKNLENLERELSEIVEKERSRDKDPEDAEMRVNQNAAASDSPSSSKCSSAAQWNAEAVRSVSKRRIGSKGEKSSNRIGQKN